MVGYCWGGTMTYVAACHLSMAAGVVYYGGGLTNSSTARRSAR